MRILLDESLPRDLAALLVGHAAVTVRDAGWSGVKNGKLLLLAATKFDVFVTADRNIEFQQNLSALPISIVRARCLDRLRRSARDRADRARNVAGRFSARRILARKGCH